MLSLSVERCVLLGSPVRGKVTVFGSCGERGEHQALSSLYSLDSSFLVTRSGGCNTGCSFDVFTLHRSDPAFLLRLRDIRLIPCLIPNDTLAWCQDRKMAPPSLEATF